MRGLQVTVLSIVFSSALPAASAGLPYTVTNTSDSGDGSLRATIALALAGGHIQFDPSLSGKTITLTSGELVIDKLLTIQGNRQITVSGGRTSRVFRVAPGGIAVLAGLTIRDGLSGSGGGIHNQSTLTLSQVTVTENRSPSGGGGGIRNEGILTIEASAISYNAAATGYGGGIDNVSGAANLTMTNTTVSGNVADGRGGGIDNYGVGAKLVARFCTIANNRAGALGGGIHGSDGDPNAVELESTILAGNGSPASPDCSGTLKSSDNNLIRSLSGCTLSGVTANNRSGDPRLGALQQNGGGVPTHPLRPGSDAMDRVPSGVCVAADARSVSRPRDGTSTGSTSCDIGAYEAAKPIVVNSLLDTFDGDKCPLRYAITAADTDAPLVGCTAGDPDTDRITFAVTGRIRLDVNKLSPTRSLLIEGPGAALLTISGERKYGVIGFSDSGGQAYGISDLTIANGAANYGAGLDGFNTSSTIAIDRVAFEDNVAALDGGGLNFDRMHRGVEIEASSFRNTAAPSAGSALKSLDSNVTIRSSTIGETRSLRAAQVFFTGFEADPASLRLIGCTIRGSEATGVQADSYDESYAAESVLEIQGSVIAGHGADFGSGDGTFVSRGDNVIGDGSGPPVATGDVKNAVTKLASHLFGGGGTKTIAPLPGSVAIDRIPLDRCPGTVDQRGVPRPLDGDRDAAFACDAGAFETAPPIVVNSLLDTSDPGKCRVRDAVAAANTNAAVNGCAAGIAQAPDLITFSVNGTINLASELTLTPSAAVRGPGAARLTLSGQGASRVFRLFDEPGGDYTITGLTIANGAADQGAGVNAAYAHTTALSEVTLRNNLATSDGGAFYALDAEAVQLEKSTFTNPGGTSASFVTLFNASGEVESCTVNDASSSSALSVVANGAGAAAYLRVKGSTVSGTGAAGIRAVSQNGAAASGARAEYSGTIVQGHATSFDLATGTGKSLGYNLASGVTGNLTAAGDQPGTNAQLGPIGYHGGQTPVFDLMLASPAKDAIALAACGPAMDQRGFARPSGSSCDIGSVERVVGGDVNGDGSVNVSDVLYLINFLFASGPVPVSESDVNGDGAVTVGDILYLINRLFAGGPAPV